MENELQWRKLDNSANIFPISAGRKYSTVFRLSVVLKENVDPFILKEALKSTLEVYKFFKVRMRSGFFWYYLENNPKEPIVEEEKEYPCKYINPKTNNDYLFKVTYFRTKINIDINHALTDGNNAATFFKELVYVYLEKKYKYVFNNERKTRKIDFDTEDSYIKNYDKSLKSNASTKKAYIIQGKKINLEAISVIHEIMNVNELRKICKEKDATITQYLSAVLIYSIYMANYKKNKKKHKNPIKVCIPVNLKKYFPSNTITNFFSYITLEAYMEKKNMQSFDDILEFVKADFEKKLTKEEISRTMSANVKLGHNPFIRGIPLTLKKAMVRTGYVEIRKYTTITFSNIGRMGIIGEYANFIDYFMLMLAPEPVEKIKCSACTFDDKIVFTFTSILNNIDIEKFFYKFLQEKGLEVKIESNGVLDDISSETKC